MGPAPPFINNKVITPWSKMIVVTGIPGARTDFLAGGLSQSHPDLFQPMTWHIDPKYGINNISPPLAWHVLHDMSTDLVQNEVNLAVDKFWKADSMWAISKSHQPSDVLQHQIPGKHADKFIFVDIIVDTVESALQVQWENFVKNILWNFTVNRRQGQAWKKLNNFIPCNLSHLSEVDALAVCLLHLFSKDSVTHTQNNFHNRSAVNSESTVLSVNYSKIMQPNGIIELATELGITGVNVDLWNQCLLRTQSPDRIFALRQWWEKPGYPL
jgi:hypothetical protein